MKVLIDTTMSEYSIFEPRLQNPKISGIHILASCLGHLDWIPTAAQIHPVIPNVLTYVLYVHTYLFIILL